MSKRISILLLAIILLIPNFSIAITSETLQSPGKEPDLMFFVETYQYIKDNYPFEVEDKQLIEGGLKGMLQTLDPYSDYYTQEEATEVYKEMFGTFSGIGVYIEEKDSYINIKDTIKDAPGQKAGLEKDDLIISIDGTSTKGMPLANAQKLIKGLIGTKVKLELNRIGKSKPIIIEVTRDRIIVNPVEYEILEGDIGYIKLKDFTQYATIEVNKALEEFDTKGIKKVILDLRNNPGGLLNQAIEISKEFIPSGPIVHIKERNKDLETHLSNNQSTKYKLVLLVNENSASASEIVAGAIKDTKAGTIIGKKTYGKGIVQSMIPLSNGSIVKMTTAEYLTPNKTSIHGVGIEPDIMIENTETEDLQLIEAIKTLK